MTKWKPGDACLLVQHDPATRLPLEEGGTFRGAVESVAGTRALVRLKDGTVLAADGDWVTEPSGGLWRLMPAPGRADGDGEAGGCRD